MRQVYLDHQASTPVLPEVCEAMRPYFTDVQGNASSMHAHGLRAREALAKARAQVAALIHAESPDDIIFTSNGTEAANLAVKGLAWANQRHGNHLIASAIEHPAVLNSIEFLEKRGFEATRGRVDGVGRVDPADVRAAMTEKTILICTHLSNHDLGTRQAIREIGEIAGNAGIPLFVDGSFGGGWLPVDVQALGIRLLSLAPHRFYGPKGVGVLYRHRTARLANLIHGGNQEGGRRAGTENVAAIVGAGVAAERAARDLEARMRHTSSLQQRLLEQLRTKVTHTRLNGPEPGPDRLGTHLNLSVEFVEGEALMLHLDLKGAAITSGTSCVSRSMKISPALAAIGLDHALARGSVLMTLGKENTAEEIDWFSTAFADSVEHLRKQSPAWEDFQRGAIRSVTLERTQGEH